ncbi:MAG: hypothetical protein BGN96_08855 [Bacteroidales bacterium 45-6]|nr:MAG: hypothetical protein BGN96_08855 [Bacteroidales bacterium 45-6]
MPVYIPNKETYVKYDISQIENATIKNIGESLGYKTCQLYIPSDSHNYGIPAIAFKLFSKEVVFAYVENGIEEEESVNRIIQYLRKFDLIESYKTCYSLRDSLREGINEECFTTDFMSSVLGIDIASNGSIESSLFGYNFIFRNGVLVDFMDSEGLSEKIRSWKDIAPHYYEKHKLLAENHFGINNPKVNKYLEMQAEAFSSISLESLKILNSHAPGANYAMFKLLFESPADTSLSIGELNDLSLAEIQKIVFFEK